MTEMTAFLYTMYLKAMQALPDMTSNKLQFAGFQTMLKLCNHPALVYQQGRVVWHVEPGAGKDKDKDKGGEKGKAKGKGKGKTKTEAIDIVIAKLFSHGEFATWCEKIQTSFVAKHDNDEKPTVKAVIQDYLESEGYEITE
jgi:putative NIF3 family GTP cyclohydrolase 1 type 2